MRRLRPKAHTYAISPTPLTTSVVILHVHAAVRNCCVVIETTVAQSVSVASPLGQGERMEVMGLTVAPLRCPKEPALSRLLCGGSGGPCSSSSLCSVWPRFD